MLTRMRSHLKFANVVSVIALFIALGGSAYAALITGKQVKNNSIQGKDVKESTLVGIDDCPTGATSRTQDICYGPAQAGANWDTAVRDCASEGLRIPDLGESLLVTNAANSPYLWTNDISDTSTGTSFRVIVRTDEPSRIAAAGTSTSQQYRCVSTPVE